MSSRRAARQEPSPTPSLGEGGEEEDVDLRQQELMLEGTQLRLHADRLLEPQQHQPRRFRFLSALRSTGFSVGFTGEKDELG
eukprot:1417492-Pyramimonas_sp.AAC.1